MSLLSKPTLDAIVADVKAAPVKRAGVQSALLGLLPPWVGTVLTILDEVIQALLASGLISPPTP